MLGPHELAHKRGWHMHDNQACLICMDNKIGGPPMPKTDAMIIDLLSNRVSDLEDRQDRVEPAAEALLDALSKVSTKKSISEKMLALEIELER